MTATEAIAFEYAEKIRRMQPVYDAAMEFDELDFATLVDFVENLNPNTLNPLSGKLVELRNACRRAKGGGR